VLWLFDFLVGDDFVVFDFVCLDCDVGRFVFGVEF